MSRARRDGNVPAAHDRLVASGALVPVELGGEDERRWLDCDLASLAENRLGEVHDPHDLDAERRADWQARATEERPMALEGRAGYERFYWLVEGGDRVGTVALATSTLGSTRLYLSSFYVRPPFRGKGTGRRALTRVQETLAAEGFGLRLDSRWCWQRTLRFYLSFGMWVLMWKREPSFVSDPDTKRPDIEIGEREATLSVKHGDGRVVLTRATRDADALLTFEDRLVGLMDDDSYGQAPWHASSTLAVALALAGWPLVRSPKEWEENRYGDGGPPEALAHKIPIWEAWARHHDWLVNTSRIPGLEYPTWTELEARWEAQSKASEASLGPKVG